MHLLRGKVPIVHAFLACPLTPAQLDSVHTEFEFGSFARFSATYHLFIHDEPRFHGKPHADIRRDLDERGMTEDFLILDDKVGTDKAAWLVSHMVSQDDVDEKQGVSTEDVWEILTYIEQIPIVKVNYDVANMSIQEDLCNCDVRWPYDPHRYPQEQIHSSGLDMKAYQYEQSAYLIAEPGEYEEASEPEGGIKLMALGSAGNTPAKNYRLKSEVASRHGLVPKWWPASSAGTAYPEGSKNFSQPWNPDHEFPPYKRLPESL